MLSIVSLLLNEESTVSVLQKSFHIYGAISVSKLRPLVIFHLEYTEFVEGYTFWGYRFHASTEIWTEFFRNTFCKRYKLCDL